MKIKNLWSIMVMLVISLSFSFVFSSCDKDDDDEKTIIDKSFSISPTDLTMLASANSKVSFSIMTNQIWTLTGTPEWLNVSAKSGEGNATIEVTALEPNSSDMERIASLIVSVGDIQKEVKITQAALYAKDTRVYVQNQLVLSDGFYADLSFDKNVLGYVEGFFYADVLNTWTLDEIYDEVINGEKYSASEYDYTIVSIPKPNTECIYCVIGYTGNGTVKQYGPMEVYNFKTKSASNYCDAIVGAITYNSTRWNYNISKQKRCHHYWKLLVANASADLFYGEYSNVILAKYIRDRIDNPDYPDYDYYLNDGTISEAREDSETSLFVWTWGVDDNGEFSGNISSSYKSTISSSAGVMKANKNELSSWHGATRSEIEEAFSNVKVEYVH